MSGLYTAATGMAAQQTMIDSISNNFANLNTVGFKAGIPNFNDLFYINYKRAGIPNGEGDAKLPVGLQIGTGAQVSSITKSMKQGNIKETGNQLDLAINGKGYFIVDMPQGTQAYTRAGNFLLNNNGEIVTTEGYKISPAIQVPINATEININQDGAVFAKIDGQIEPADLGRFDMATFINDAGLESIGNNLFLETVGSGEATVTQPNTEGSGKVLQFSVETSNSDVLNDMVNLLHAQRAFETIAKLLDSYSNMYKLIANTQT